MAAMPLAIWFGFLTIIMLFVTFSLGIAMAKFKKNVFRYHVASACTTVALAIAHLILAYLLWFQGVAI